MSNEGADRRRRRELRLGALLFQIHYYMATPEDIANRIYRLCGQTYVQVRGERVLFARDADREWLELEAAITRCKEALAGRGELHRGSTPRPPSRDSI